MTRSSFTALSCLWSVVALTAACAGSAGSPNSNTDPLENDAVCPAITKPDQIHAGDVKGAETWAADAVHVVSEDLYVRDGAKVVVAPCAEVRVANGRSIYVDTPGTSFVADGTAQRPIFFSGQNGGRWNRFYVTAPATARFAYTTFSNGGGADIDARGQETLGIAGDDHLPAKEVVFVDHVTIQGSGGAGLRIDRGATFASGSQELTITGAGALSDEHPYPLEITEPAVTSLPTGSFIGNQRDEILLATDEYATRTGFQADATIHDRGVPYHVGRDAGHADLGVGYGPTPAVLTIDAGVTLLFEKGNGLMVHSSKEEGVSAIVAKGTREKPVTFSSASRNPAPGDWRGITFFGPMSADNLIEHAVLAYTGADCGCELVSCSENAVSEGAIVIGEPAPKMFLFDSEITHGSANGVVQGWDGPTLDFRSSNVFEDVTGCHVTEPRNADTTCPSVVPTCK